MRPLATNEGKFSRDTDFVAQPLIGKFFAEKTKLIAEVMGRIS